MSKEMSLFKKKRRKSWEKLPSNELIEDILKVYTYPKNVLLSTTKTDNLDLTFDGMEYFNSFKEQYFNKSELMQRYYYLRKGVSKGQRGSVRYYLLEKKLKYIEITSIEQMFY